MIILLFIVTAIAALELWVIVELVKRNDMRKGTKCKKQN